MKVLVFSLLAALLGVLSVVAGVAVGIGGFAYGVYMLILLFKGTLAVTFWALFKVILCLLCSSLVGWLTFGFFAFLAAVCAAIASDK
jgi:hypothetical protein